MSKEQNDAYKEQSVFRKSCHLLIFPFLVQSLKSYRNLSLVRRSVGRPSPHCDSDDIGKS
jgi:hypothetical protein